MAHTLEQMTSLSLVFVALALTTLPQLARAQAGSGLTIELGTTLPRHVGSSQRWQPTPLQHRFTEAARFDRSVQCSACAVTTPPSPIVAELDKRAERGGSYAYRGMAIGLVAGAAIGAFIIAPCPNGNSGSEGPLCGVGQAQATIMSGVGGLVVGGVIGALWPRRQPTAISSG